MHDFWLRRGKTLRYNAIKLRILTLKQGEKKLRIFAEMNLKVLFIGWIKLLPGPLCTACAHAGAFCFIKRKSLKLLGSSRSFKLCCALPQRIRALSRRSHSAGGAERICKNMLFAPPQRVCVRIRIPLIGTALHLAFSQGTSPQVFSCRCHINSPSRKKKGLMRYA